MFERFTDRARRVVILAQEEARLLNHNYIGTEHILLGLIHEHEGVAAKALESLDISLESVRGQVEEIIGQGAKPPDGHIPFTPRAKRVLELSLREALQLGHNYIGTEHILLGLIREGEGVAARVLVKLGADLARVREQVVHLLATLGEVSSSASGGEAERLVGEPSASRSRVLASRERVNISRIGGPRLSLCRVVSPGSGSCHKCRSSGLSARLSCASVCQCVPSDTTGEVVTVGGTT